MNKAKSKVEVYSVKEIDLEKELNEVLELTVILQNFANCVGGHGTDMGEGEEHLIRTVKRIKEFYKNK